MVAELKARDIYQRKGHASSRPRLEILYVGEECVFIRYVDNGREASMSLAYLEEFYIKVKPFFEVGKTYSARGETFRVDYIGEIDGMPYAAGVYRVSASRAPYATAFTALSDWQEV